MALTNDEADLLRRARDAFDGTIHLRAQTGHFDESAPANGGVDLRERSGEDGEGDAAPDELAPDGDALDRQEPGPDGSDADEDVDAPGLDEHDAADEDAPIEGEALIEDAVDDADEVAASEAQLEDQRSIEHLLAHSFGTVGVAIGAFSWPSGAPFWSNTTLAALLDLQPHDTLSLMGMLDEWSQAHFLVRVLPEVLRRGSWQGRLAFITDGGRSEPMLTTIVGHPNQQGLTDALTVFAMPLGGGSVGRDTIDAEPEPEAVDAADTAADADADADVLAPEAPDRSQQFVAALVQHVNDLIVVTDPAGVITFASPAARSLLGLTELAGDGAAGDEATGDDAGDDATDARNLLSLVHPDDLPPSLAELARAPGEGPHSPIPLRLRAADGEWRDMAAVLTDLTTNPAVGGYVLNAQDVTETLRAELALTAKAYTDELTGLANRVRLLDRLEGLADAPPPDGCTLVVVRIDELERVDLAHGVAAVDGVIRVVGQRLAALATENLGSLAARLQGEELALLAPGIDTAAAARRLGDRIRDAVREPVHVSGHSVHVTASVGVATTQMARPDDAFDEILARADLAMHEAESAGRDRTVLYDTPLAQRLQHRRSVDQQLRRALDSDGLCMRFQPIVELPSLRVVGAEALLRVRGDDGELLSPGAFVETAESSGLITRLGAAVVRATCDHLAALDVGEQFEISVNVSPRQVAARDFATSIIEVLGESGVPASQLKLEITEGAFFGRNDASENNIITLRDEGVRVGLDEFGGDTSLGYLRRFPLDFVKIDRSLIAGLGANYVDGTIVRATIELAHKLGLTTVAVGVETDEQRSRLEQLGCDRAQGYLFGGALAPEDLPALLER